MEQSATRQNALLSISLLMRSRKDLNGTEQLKKRKENLIHGTKELRRRRSLLLNQDSYAIRKAVDLPLLFTLPKSVPLASRTMRSRSAGPEPLLGRIPTLPPSPTCPWRVRSFHSIFPPPSGSESPILLFRSSTSECKQSSRGSVGSNGLVY